jgi:hypothetical protein
MAGFTLLEFLLALSLFFALFVAATSVFRRTEKRFSGTASEMVRTLERSRLIHQLEDDLLAAVAGSIFFLPDGVVWTRKGQPSRCAYRLDRRSGSLHRLLLESDDPVAEAILDRQTVFLENVAEFSLARQDNGKLMLLLRFLDENFTALVPFGP